ncbi:MAG: TPR end-of-group domain-containing protein, partial [Planctomycetota bacterium]
ALEKALSALQETLEKALDGAKTPKEKIEKMNQVLLKDREVSYISNKYWRDSTLAASLLRNKGNCLATSTLYAVVGQRLGLPVKAVLTPNHAFARWDGEGMRINIETTDRGRELPDTHYHGQTPWILGDDVLLGYGRSLTDAKFSAVLHRYAASHLRQTRRPDQALEMLEKAKALWPENPDFDLLRLDILYHGLGRHREALEGFQRIANQGPGSESRVRAILGLSAHLQGLNRHDQALRLLRNAYGRAPKYIQSSVLSRMADSYRTLRRFDEALMAQELSTILEGREGDYTGLAIYYKNAGKMDDAIRCLQISMKRNPENWNTRLILAGYLIRAKRDEEGWRVFATVEKPRVNLVHYYTNVAWFYGSVGKKKEFLEALDQALNLSRTPGILDYIRQEVDFDAYRKDGEFKALVAKHEKRLLGKK